MEKERFMYLAHSDCANINTVESIPEWERDVKIMLNIFKLNEGGVIKHKIIDNVSYDYIEKSGVVYVPRLRKDIALNIKNTLHSVLNIPVELFSLKTSVMFAGKEGVEGRSVIKFDKVTKNKKSEYYNYEYNKGFNTDCFLAKDERYQCPCCHSMLSTLDEPYQNDTELRQIVKIPRFMKKNKLKFLDYNKDFADINKIDEYFSKASATEKAKFEEQTGVKLSNLLKKIKEQGSLHEEKLEYVNVSSKIVNTMKEIMSKDYKILFDFETMATDVPVKLGQMAGKDYLIEACVSVYNRNNELIDEFKDIIQPDASFRSNAPLLNNMFEFCAKYMYTGSYIFMSYNKNFENSVLTSLLGYWQINDYKQNMSATFGPKNILGAQVIKDITANNFDLMFITNFAPVKTKSLKRIYELLCEEQPDLKKYSDINIKDGLEATNMYKNRMFKKEKLTEKEFEDLIEYCQLDTRCMMDIFIDAYAKIIGLEF